MTTPTVTAARTTVALLDGSVLPRRALRPLPARPESAPSDAALVHAAAEGSDQAWKTLVTRYTGLVASISRSYRLGGADAGDVEQLVWMRLLENLDRIRQPELIGGWIAAVTRNACLSIQRRAAREVSCDDERAYAVVSPDDIEADLVAHERRVAVRRALRGLPQRGRVLLETLLDNPGLSYEEVGRRLGMPVGSIGPTRQRCLDRLRGAPELADLACPA